MATTAYRAFLEAKCQVAGGGGFEPVWLPDFLFAFQRWLVEWALRQGRAAIFADCGLGKTPMQLVWAANVVQKTGRPVLILTPLAVAQQTQREAAKFGIDCHLSRDGAARPGITVTNYERLHHFDPSAFAGFVCDESSCLKAFDGKRRKQITRLIAKAPYRLLCTATPSPNDYIELGTSAEALGVMAQSDMLSYFFVAAENMRHTLLKEDDFWNKVKWHFKPHAEQPFWRWVCSWARACRTPEDLGFDGSRFQLPPLEYRHHVLDVPFIPAGELFPRPALSLHEARLERHRSLRERCEKVAELVRHDQQAIVWCHWNEEGDLLEELIDDAVQVAGSDQDEVKEARLADFALGNVRVLVTKPKIGCWGLNFQRCGHMTFFPSFSFEQFYQAVRRCWRFGRTDPVGVDIVSATGESGVMARLEVKQEKYERLFRELVAHMRHEWTLCSNDQHTKTAEVPAWLQ